MAEIIEPIEEFGLSTKHKKRSLFSKIGVVGCGRDGRHIVSLTALSGMEVVFIEVSDERIQEALRDIENGLDTKIENWGLTQSEKRATMGRVKGSLNYSDLKGCDFVIECIRYEANGERSIELRKEVFRNLELVLAPDAIIATNATTVIISELAADLTHKERCISLHFPITHTEAKLLEVVRGTFTSQEAIDKIYLFANMIKYTPIPVHESSGLVSFRLLIIMLNEACEIWMENVASIEDIDKEFTIIYGQRYGIFHLADIIGIEKLVMMMEDMFHEYGDKKYKASPVLWRLYRSKQLGKSTGRGFYIYDKAGKQLGLNNLI
ncbi:3-hydroxybutyryl-CoA dehydrogenase [Dysgonomonas sp. PFB1-18]|uniref:3-hydroxyacyl-CoA dehydrogenase family protein n=1 Tax=unclassified Dysgonomonas TaxID=2630389 RepID=UPI00247418B3|nr:MULTISPECIES: 3-hydroxyacyl-CoA dehydrogenase NAD-binding domain-containing protein [unclassified Dysgonomonas]MDH6310813.1 3-hydroxybutyryl-CoA dehydrogenase [Dysgonomonas sp. PF1-14]MDH6340663.1 3-hydroxybutyryl-CoA dehydrogenase [Dysgonomonas sp. PF1-16]MDH6382230.1 3-hydroxybutyryl-CoA dehydrogenase [Dysgonomonas sp. PFB1-18]MDH6399633.1 3-hydroxybutyryl-CoA dehydrogenase [Dysgonomonas sp. PF1-23]